MNIADMFNDNPILGVDSYKHSHYLQYPPEVIAINSYIEARKTPWERLVFFGGRYAIQRLTRQITMDHIEEAMDVLPEHGVPFNYEGWKVVVDEYDGKLPLRIDMLPEGSVVPAGIPLVQVKNTNGDGRMKFLTSFVETDLLRSIWYPTTVASLSWAAKRIIRRGMMKTSDTPFDTDFKLNDFGARGVSSDHSAALGGLGHLVNFKGTDNLEAIMLGRRVYGCNMAGYNISAAEHSTVTSWGYSNEKAFYEHMIDTFDAPGKIFAVVSDSYDLENAIRQLWGHALRDKVRAMKGTLVIRPDSGDPVETPIQAIKWLMESFSWKINEMGYCVLPPQVRVIQGDGMNLDSIQRLIDRLIEEKISIDNIAFGMGGGLLQGVNRDTLAFAMKASAVYKQGENGLKGWHGIRKQPKTDMAKASKMGIQKVTMEVIGEDLNDPYAWPLEWYAGEGHEGLYDTHPESDNMLQPVFFNGKIIGGEMFEDIRARVERQTPW